MKTLFLLLGILGAFLQAQAQYLPPVFTDPGRLQKIEKVIPVIENIYKNQFENSHFPGLAFGVVVDGKLIYSKGFGYTDLEKKTPVTSQSLFRIASMTKSITAMAILKLRDEGKLQLDDPVEKYIPQLKKSPGLTKDSPLITIRHLLTHATGLPEDNPYGDRQLADTDQELLDFIANGLSYSNAPGLVYEYSNLGFAMLGRIITVVSKKPYQQYINETIFQPLGMTNTIWEYTKAPANLWAHGYRWEEGKWKEEIPLHDGSHGAMGGLITSIDDFSKYVAVHLAAWPPRDDRESGPVKRSSVREMQHPWNFSGLVPNRKYPNGATGPSASAYAYGLRWVSELNGRVGITHSGGLPGYGSQWYILPEYGIGVIAYANLTYSSLGNANWLALDTLITMAGLKPRELPVSVILAKRKDELVAIIKNWDITTPIFAENFFPDRSRELRKKDTQELLKKIGTIQNITPLIPENQLRGTFFIEGTNGKLQIFFTLTPESPALIQQLDITEVK
ncbi:MAG: serine hydrolase domain-containing protein [Siphonobacter sp.]